MNSRMTFWLALAILIFGSSGVYAESLVGFGQPLYEVQVGQPFKIQILFDAEASTPGIQLLPEGLFTMGCHVGFDTGAFQLSGLETIEIPSLLNNNGLGDPAFKELNGSGLGFAGAVSFGHWESYTDPLLATITLTPTTQGDFTFSLSEYFTSANKANFVDFTGQTLDAEMLFGTTTVRAVPEPSTLLLLLTALASLLWMRRF